MASFVVIPQFNLPCMRVSELLPSTSERIETRESPGGLPCAPETTDQTRDVLFLRT